ncbi:hypothetical protein [Escherichia phage pEC-M719-6WT.1]|uniref:Uncharacterized protein n=1 Tax=Escherichia phage pEC-M719-6WT.1 TaxID=3056220 RepID=A0AA51YFR8_9CAUD|nr:hypothetical protein [Escherichia phage pEC-M719-6WT.1]
MEVLYKDFNGRLTVIGKPTILRSWCLRVRIPCLLPN